MDGQYYRDIFYDTSTFTLSDKISICKWAKRRSFQFIVDELDCTVSWCRKIVDMSFNDILKKLDDSSHFCIIHRKGYEYKKNVGNRCWNLEISFRTMGKFDFKDYFLWIYCDEKYVPDIIKKFKLEEM